MMDEVTYLCDLALTFAQVNRTGVQLHNGQPESDSDHTVMLGWVACAFAAKHYPELDVGLIAQFALVHDAPEIYAGDVQSLGMSADQAKQKQLNEALAIKRLESEVQLPWFVDTIKLYEQQIMAEARYVRAIDKVLPKIVAYLNDCTWLIETRSWEQLATELNSQLKTIKEYAGEFEALIILYRQTAYRIIKYTWHEQVAK